MSTDVEKVQKKKPTEVEAYKEQREWLLGIAERAPLRGGLTKERLALSTLQAMKKKPELMDVEKTDMESLRIAIVEAGQMGLIPDGRRGALVKYGREVQFQPMVWGIVELMIRAGVKKVESRVVYANDRYEIEYGTNPRIVHVPARENRGAPIAAYAVVWLPAGDTQFEPMTKEEIYVIRARSKSFQKKQGPWMTDELEMWRKTVVKRLGKYVPQTDELTLAIQRDDEIEYVDATVEDDRQALNRPTTSRTDEIAAELGLPAPSGNGATEKESPAADGSEDATSGGTDDAVQAGEIDEATAEQLDRLHIQYTELFEAARPGASDEERLQYERTLATRPANDPDDPWGVDEYEQASEALKKEIAKASRRKKARA